jgi:MFS family permease
MAVTWQGVVQVGALLTVGAAGAALATVVAGVLGDAVGRRWTLVTLSGLMALAGIVLIVSESFPVLLIAAFVMQETTNPSTPGVQPYTGTSTSHALPLPTRLPAAFTLKGVYQVKAGIGACSIRIARGKLRQRYQ